MKRAKLNRIKQKIEAAELLIKQEFFLDAISLYWQACRDYIFYWLTKNNIEYNSTTDALRLAIINMNNETREKIIQVEIVGTLAEWDEFFSVTKEQMIDFKDSCTQILKSLKYGGN